MGVGGAEDRDGCSDDDGDHDVEKQSLTENRRHGSSPTLVVAGSES